MSEIARLQELTASVPGWVAYLLTEQFDQIPIAAEEEDSIPTYWIAAPSAGGPAGGYFELRQLQDGVELGHPRYRVTLSARVERLDEYDLVDPDAAGLPERPASMPGPITLTA